MTGLRSGEESNDDCMRRGNVDIQMSFLLIEECVVVDVVERRSRDRKSKRK